MVERLLLGRTRVEPDPSHSEVEERFRAVCLTLDGRAVFIVFTLRKRNGVQFVRPISARYMHKRELKRYEEEIS
jgi:uncharacterized protein